MTASVPAADEAVERPRPERPADQQPWRWHLDRAAMVLLVVLVPVHFAVTFLVDDLGSTARTVSARLDDPTWRLITWLTLALALLHATLSADAALRVRRPGRGGTVATAAVGLLAGALLAAATWVLATRWV